MASEALRRLLDPRSIAIVGASDKQVFAQGLTPTFESDLQLHMIHPKRPQVFGYDTYPSLKDVGKPVDAVMCLVNAEQTMQVVREAGEIGAGGVVCVAAGFADVGAEGRARQDQLSALAEAADLALCGPNGTGYVNLNSGAYMTITPPIRRKRGNVSLISASGGMLAVVSEAANLRGVGFSYLISPGNEAVVDAAGYLDFLADDPNTHAIAIILESIRRPEAFFAAAARALQAGKPIVALRFGRTATARRISQSHTGSVVHDSWVYDVALRQAGIELARDLDDLVDRVQLFDALAPERWPSGGVALLTASGGGAALASDIASEEGVDLPPLDQLVPYVEKTLPGIHVPNPLDMTGFIVSRPELFRETLQRYLAEPDVEALLYISGVSKGSELMSGPTNAVLGELAGTTEKAIVMCGMSAVPVADWVQSLRDQGIGIGNGPRGSLRSLATMTAFQRRHARLAGRVPVHAPPIAQPDVEVVETATGRSLPFDACMELLASVGIPVAPYHVIGADEAIEAAALGFDGPYVVKLADLPHRTDHGAVRVGVAAGDLEAIAGELRELAAREDVPARVAIQPMVAGTGEAFIGITGSELGPLVLCGVGGVLVEVLRKVAGRLAPIGADEAGEMLAELDDTRVFDGFRGAPPWDRERLAQIVAGASRLAAGTAGWLESIDINPLIFGPAGFVAVDGLALVAGVESGADDERLAAATA